jgi:hypothetical protein
MRKKLSTILGTVLCVLLCAVAYNADAGPGESLGYHKKSNALNAVALNAAAASRTFTVDTSRYAYGSITFWMYFDYGATAGQISLTCTGGPSASDNGYTLTVCAAASTEGECTAVNSGIMKSVAGLSADTKWDHRMELHGAMSLECVAAHGGAAGATDKITVHYMVMEE